MQRWHDVYPGCVYVQNVLTASSARPLVVVDQQVPQNVIPREGPTSFEVPSQVFKPLGDRLVASLRVNDPDALDASGVPYRATITAQRESDEGPVTGCGYPIGVSPTTIPLDPVPGRDPLSEFWWGSIGYLAGDNGSATFTIDGVSTDMEVQRGLHDFVFLGRGPVDEVVMESRSDMAMCVDNVKAGTIAPRQPEEADR